MMIPLGANLDQLNEISGGLGAKIVLSNAGKRIFEHNLDESMQCRSPARDDRDFGFEKEIEFSRKWSLGAARALGDRLDTAHRLGAPGNDQTAVAKLAFAQQDRGRAYHARNLARDQLIFAFDRPISD